MSITGHKTEKDFWTYIRLKQNEKAKLLMEDYESRSSVAQRHASGCLQAGEG